MHRELVEERPWLSEDQFLRALSLCMLLPGPEAMQLATFAGWRLRGTIGGLLAGALFVLPGAAVIFVLAFGYVAFGHVPLVQAAFLGVKAAVLVIVLQALRTLSKKALRTPSAWGLAVLAFLAVFAVGVPFPAIIAAAALYGAWAFAPLEAPVARPLKVRPRDSLARLFLWGGLWAVPIAMAWAAQADFLVDIALFFSKLAVVTFGGAYAVLAYMTQTVVADYGWISTGQMIDALGLAETTPGPLILVTQFVAILAGVEAAGTPLGITAGLLALWVTFVPCFLWIFLAGPYLDALTARPRLDAGLRAITAAVVGVILNLALWFGIHVMFDTVGAAGWHAAPIPVWHSLDLQALGLFLLAAALMLGLGRPMLQSLALMAAAGIGVGLL
jgi:chromate transporter